MIKLIMYDIEKDKTRTKLARDLEAIGFTRIQYSVFLGNVKKHLIKDLIHKYRQKLALEDKLFSLNVSEKYVRDMVAIGFDEDLEGILKTRHTLFF